MRQSQAKCINNREEELIKESSKKSGVNTEINRKLQTAAILSDRGDDNEDLIDFYNLAYLPGWALPKLPHNPNRRAAEDWVTKEVYLTSLEAQVEIANSARIYECNMNRTCNAIFSTPEQAEYHRVTNHQMMNYGYTRFW